MKRIGIGLSDFKHLIEEDFYYFDKTKFIDEIIKDGAQVKLFTRPRRFGKTLNMSMLKYFFDIKEAEENRKLFKNLYIEKTETFKEQGQYPVVFLSLKDLKATTWGEMEKGIKSTISRLFLDYRYLLNDLDKFDTIIFENIIMKNTNIEDLKEALKFLTESLYKKYSQKVVVLIDEYDSPLVSAYINGYYNKAKDFFKTFYSIVLKDNSYLQMGILTGIIRVIKAGIFSDLNNLRTYTILSDDYTDSYGLTEEEVEKSLKDYGLEYEISKVKDWYDGYKFGNSEVYNPWSILNFLQDKELRAYWVDTSGNDLINDVLKKITKDTVRALERLFNGEGLRQNISGTSDLSKILSDDEIWELLLFSGYLTIEEKIDQDNYILRLPNKEVKSLFRKTFIETYIARGSKLSFLMESLIENKIEDYMDDLDSILVDPLAGDKVGKFKYAEDEYFQYKNYLTQCVKGNFKDMKIVLDTANGAAYRAAKDVFLDLRAELVVINDAPNGRNINVKCGSTHPEILAKVVVGYEADLGLAYDGDADRLIAVDKFGNIIDGDKIIGILALGMKNKGTLKNNKVVTTVMSNIGFEKYLKENDIELLRANVGDRNVLEKMLAEDIVIGGEQSGHIILKDYATTGDGVLSSLKLVEIIRDTGKDLHELVSAIKDAPQTLINVKVNNAKKNTWDKNEKIIDYYFIIYDKYFGICKCKTS